MPKIEVALQVMERQLRKQQYMAREYSIADIILFPWVDSHATHAPQLLEDAPEVRRWLKALWARPAVQRGMKVPERAG